MTHFRHRILFCGAVGLLLVIGAILQPRATDGVIAATLPVSTSLPGHVEGQERKTAEEALYQRLHCVVSVLGFQLPQAEKSCGSVIDLRPSDAIGYKYRGLAYLLEHRFERAEADFRDAVRLDPKDSENQAGYAQSLSGQGRFDEAVSRFGVALAISPRDVRYLSARCWARAGQGTDFAAAFRDCNLALTLSPHNAVAFDARALVHLRAGQNATARSDFSSSLRWQPERATALFGRGVAEIRMNLGAAARRDLSLARQIDPEIDDTYIQVGVLEFGCNDGLSACSLPPEFRIKPEAPSKYLSVSLRKFGMPQH